jgi:hypothetical protein
MISRKAAREALIGAHAGRVLSRVILKNQSADAVPIGGRQHQQMRNREHLLESARSKTPACMKISHARTGGPASARHEVLSGEYSSSKRSFLFLLLHQRELRHQLQVNHRLNAPVQLEEGRRLLSRQHSQKDWHVAYAQLGDLLINGQSPLD